MSADQLPCGAPIDDLIAQVSAGGADRRTVHQAGCPHCQAALAEYDRIFSPLRELAAEPVPVPDTVLEEVLRRIRGSLSDPAYAVLPGPDGDTRIAGRIVATIARTVTEQVPGVRVALARVQERTTNGADGRVVAGVAGTSTALRITLAAGYGKDLHAVAEQVRQEVARTVRATTGLEAVEIHVIIDDVIGADTHSANDGDGRGPTR